MKIHILIPKDLQEQFTGKVFDKLKGFVNGQPATLAFDFHDCGATKIKSGINNDDYSASDKLLGTNLDKIGLFAACKAERKRLKIDDKDIVILLADRTNNHNLNSCWDCATRNAFVTLNYFDLDPKKEYLNICEIAQYQIFLVVVRVIQNMTFDEAKLHKANTSCIYGNYNKTIDFFNGISAAKICESCLDKIKNAGLKEVEYVNLKAKFAVMAELAGVAALILRNSTQHKIKIDDNLKLTVPSVSANELLTEPLFKAIYFLFLNHPEGILTIDMSKHKDELRHIYSSLDNRDDTKLMKQSIDDITTEKSDLNKFSEKKSKLNRKITELLGEQLAPLYRIEGAKGKPFKIGISRDLVEGLDHVKALIAAKK